MIGVIDYGAGNLHSVSNALTHLDLSHRLIRHEQDLDDITAIILPGVGHFGSAMQSLQKSGLVPFLRQWLAADRPFLGICLGLQLLFDSSEEAPEQPGLGIIPGTVRRFRAFKIPQIGWNQVRQIKTGPLFQNCKDESFFYFIHGYYVEPRDTKWTAGTTDYSLEYVSAVENGRIAAVQFHPEKSGAVGFGLMRSSGASC